jgi:hypothetical protein
MPRDQFAAESGYDPDEIHTASQDEHGHSVQIRVYVPKTWYSIAKDVENSDLWPEYKSVAAFMRDAMYHRMHWIAEQKGRGSAIHVEEALAVAQATRSLYHEEARDSDMAKFREHIDKVLGAKLADKDYTGVADWIEEFRRIHLPKFREPYHSRVEIQLDTYARRAEMGW